MNANYSPMHWRTLPARQHSDRRAARVKALASVLAIPVIVAGVFGLVFTLRFLGL